MPVLQRYDLNLEAMAADGASIGDNGVLAQLARIGKVKALQDKLQKMNFTVYCSMERKDDLPISIIIVGERKTDYNGAFQKVTRELGLPYKTSSCYAP